MERKGASKPGRGDRRGRKRPPPASFQERKGRHSASSTGTAKVGGSVFRMRKSGEMGGGKETFAIPRGEEPGLTQPVTC